MAHKSPEFEKLVLDGLAKWKVPGIAVAVIHGDEIAAKGYGFARLSGEKCTADTVFDCASNSKSFTAAAVALLVHDVDNHPDIQWTTPVSKILPEDFVLPDPYYTENTTIEDILSHRSGMPGHDLSYLGAKSTAPDDPKSVTRNLRNLPLSQPPRSKFQYCNMMFTAASYMVEVVTGEPFGEVLRTRFWEPLGMRNTYHDISGVQLGKASVRLAHGYEWNEDDGRLVEIPFIEQPEGQGAGLVFSSANDYARWVRALIKRAGPLCPAAHMELIKPRAILDEDEEERRPYHSQPLYALGLIVESYRGRTVVEHNGAVAGFNSAMRYLPELEWGVVILGNSGEAHHLAEELYLHLVDELLCIPAPERIHREEKRDEEAHPELGLADSSPDPQLDLLNYAGQYRNAGYHDIRVEIKDGRLFADCSDRTFGFTLAFDRVSGDDCVAEMRDIYNGMKRVVGANFEVGQGGRVSSLGIELEEEMKAVLIRFERV